MISPLMHAARVLTLLGLALVLYLFTECSAAAQGDPEALVILPCNEGGGLIANDVSGMGQCESRCVADVIGSDVCDGRPG